MGSMFAYYVPELFWFQILVTSQWTDQRREMETMSCKYAIRALRENTTSSPGLLLSFMFRFRKKRSPGGEVGENRHASVKDQSI